MKRNHVRMLRTVKAIIPTVVFLATASIVSATTHVIQFGGAFGLNYSPKSLNVATGDTVKWEGDFTMHPLSSTSVPAGAASFHKASGSVFSYAVLIAGTYLYQCDAHHASGMTGSFVASGTGVEEGPASLTPGAFRLDQNFPNPFNSSTVIRFTLPAAQKAVLKVYSVTGDELATLADGVIPAGSVDVRFDGSGLPSGTYFFRLVTGEFSDTKRFVLLK